MNAHWIWAHNLQGTDEVWCRITTGNHPYDDGMFAMTEGFNNGQLHTGADDSATIYIVRPLCLPPSVVHKLSLHLLALLAER